MTGPTKRNLLLAAAGFGAFLAARSALRRGRAFSLRGKTVLITGGSRGLGLVLARELVREGARVAICARDPDELDRARADLFQRGGQVFTVTCDITDQACVKDMAAAVWNHFGAIDVLINNAGVIEVGP